MERWIPRHEEVPSRSDFYLFDTSNSEIRLERGKGFGGGSLVTWGYGTDFSLFKLSRVFGVFLSHE